jgi:hypothetical protein
VRNGRVVLRLARDDIQSGIQLWLGGSQELKILRIICVLTSPLKRKYKSVTLLYHVVQNSVRISIIDTLSDLLILSRHIIVYLPT